MRKLPQYAKHLLLQGASTLGNFTEGFYFVEEEIKVKDADELFEFCKWIDNHIGGASRNNIEMLFLAFKNNLELAKQASDLADLIKSLKR
jgi:hypothetical protein